MYTGRGFDSLTGTFLAHSLLFHLRICLAGVLFIHLFVSNINKSTKINGLETNFLLICKFYRKQKQKQKPTSKGKRKKKYFIFYIVTLIREPSNNGTCIIVLN